MPPASRSPSPLSSARLFLGFTQAELAEMAGVTRETVSRLERGDYPSRRTADRIAAALSVGVETLFPDQGRIGR